MVISTIKEIQFGQMALTFQIFNSLHLFYTYSLNSAMAALGSLSFVLSIITGIASLLMIDYEDEYQVFLILKYKKHRNMSLLNQKLCF